MKRNLDLPITQLDGTEFKEKLTLQKICFSSIISVLPSDESLDITTKLKFYQLAKKISEPSPVELSAEDLTLLKERIGKVCAHVVVIGKAFELLDTDYVEATG